MMSVATNRRTSVFTLFRLTRRDLKVFAFSALLFGSVAVGAVSFAQPATGQTTDAGSLCSSARYFR